MSRDWIAVYAAVLGRPKYRRLPVAAKAALFHTWLLAGAQTPEATWPSVADLEDVLDLDGYPAGTVDELVSRGWLDIDPSGRVLVHDWDEHQLAASDAARRAYEADRKGEWRRRKRAELDTPSPVPPTPDNTGFTSPDITSHDMTLQESPNVPDVSGTRTDTGSWSTRWEPFLTQWKRLGYRHPPSEKQRQKLWPVIDGNPLRAAGWLSDAPPRLKSYEAVAYVISRWEAAA